MECGSHHRRSSNHSNHSGLRRCGCYGGFLNGSDHYKLHHHHQDHRLLPHRHTPRGSDAVAAHVDASRRRPRSTRPVAAAAAAEYTTPSGPGRCDDGEFTLDSAEVAEEAAVERKEVRRVKPLLSELQVPEWQELAKADRRKWRNMLKSISIRIRR
jgi:hypothetical protein